MFSSVILIQHVKSQDSLYSEALSVPNYQVDGAEW